ncbi:MAG: divergent PAP2 family protein [Lachnospiraceae bacterium]|nr:divergent PAP2 family protein [Lachnospiraceae bacterium]
MNSIIHIFTNPFLVTSLSSWAIAQVLKVFLHAYVTGKFDITRLFGDGGMPSGHSATVTSLATITGLMYGFDSFQFAMAAVFAVVVCHDAMGVRLETGKQAQMLNEIIKVFETVTKHDLPDVILKEFVGHTLPQVTAGVLLGIVDAVFVYYVILV